MNIISHEDLVLIDTLVKVAIGLHLQCPETRVLTEDELKRAAQIWPSAKHWAVGKAVLAGLKA